MKNEERSGGRPHSPSQRRWVELSFAWVKIFCGLLLIRHILCALHHPQTNGKIERFHDTMTARLNLLVYTSAEQLPRRGGILISGKCHLSISD
jgi:hypothetical protein